MVVTLSASDTTSGLADIEVNIDQSPQFARYSGPLSIAGDGAHNLVYLAIDNAGNLGAPTTLFVPIDGTPPTINVNPVGTQANAGWYKSNVGIRAT